ncbi:hypothetical protein BDW59DRAFT_165118 [Aspergillus cavernicola]|uniref:Fungal STAND N-terminal Goodbye domain-containing protein n=1 Tax=Aspergillus cavernicola TaxID=176166 RepID=A0ABR4HUU2_9EURO
MSRTSHHKATRGVIFDALKTALIPVQLFGNLAAGGASMGLPPSSMGFGAVTYLLNAAKGVSASYDAIQALMATLKDFTIRLKSYSRESVSEDLSDKLSDVLVTLIEVFALSTKTIRRGRLLKFSRNFLLGNNDGLQAAMGKLDSGTGRVVDDISVTVNTTSATVTETGMTGSRKAAKSEQRRCACFVTKILRPKTDSAQDWFDKISKVRIPGTGDWVREEDIFKDWVDKKPPIIFVSGNPGAGKSYLSSNITSFLREQYPQYLLEDAWNPFPLMAMIWGYQKLAKRTKVKIFESLSSSAEELIEAAEFGDLEKNALWYRRCALVLREAEHHEKAIEFSTTH